MTNDSLKITQNDDGSYAAEWDKNDPTWKFMNSLTSKQIQVIMEQALASHLQDPLNTL
jgi:hypothetical protein